MRTTLADSRLTGCIAVIGVALAALAAVITAANVEGDATALAAVGRASMVALPIGVGLYALHRRPGDRFGLLLTIAGFAWFLTTLAESGNEVVYSIGRVSGWLVEPGLIYLILVFPFGRLASRVDRALVWTAVALVAAFYLPSALISDSYSVPAPWTSCTSSCPDNAFFLLGSEPGFVDSVMVPVREVLTVLLFAAVTLRLVQRVRDASALARLTLTPVLGVAALRLAVLCLLGVTRFVDSGTTSGAVASWLFALGLPAMALAFLIGLLRWRLHISDRLQGLEPRLSHTSTREELSASLADMLDDPSLEVLYRVRNGRGRWVDTHGRSRVLPASGDGRALTEIRVEGEQRAIVVHDPALADQTEFVRAAAWYALVALENHRLTARIESSLRQTRESRARILASADTQRRRIEQNLHDGAQQRLVALRVQLELTEELLQKDPDRGLAKLHTLGPSVEETIDEIRLLAQGVYPSLLANRGLAEALRAAAQTGPIHATVQPDGVGRYPSEVESAVYFCCLEALQNAYKHAAGAKTISISLADGDGLRFEVSDDGAGFDVGATPAGAGLTNMRDRLAAIGGEVTVSSSSGGGTVVSGSVLLPPATNGRFGS
jgi:signal transduction histidine kinase